jgi:hypothetical protein
MAVELNPEQERIVGRAIAAGLIEKAEDAVEVGVRTIRRWLETQTYRANPLSHEERSKALHEFVNRDRPDAPLLSNEAIGRESIYSDRGL